MGDRQSPWAGAVSIAISDVVPAIAYFLIRPHVGGDAEALALAWLIPMIWTVASSLWLRRLDVSSLLPVVGYGLAVGVSVFFGLGSLPLKLHRAVIAALFGVVCLVSVAAGHPIMLFYTRLRLRRLGYVEQAESLSGHAPTVVRITRLTLLVGVAALIDSAVQTYFAFTLSAGRYLIARAILHDGVLAAIGLGLLLYFLYSKSQRKRQRA